MKHIRESFEDKYGLAEYIQRGQNMRVDEGWKDFFNTVKRKFKLVYEYLLGLVVKAGSYFIPVDDEGNLQSCISPLTAGQAYADGKINKASTVVVMDKEGRKITGCKGKITDAKKLYGSGNSIQYWTRMLKECEELYGKDMINEVKLHREDPEAKYSVIADSKTLQKIIEMHVQRPKLAKLLIWGAPGIGKTAILMNVVETMLKKYPDYKLIMKTLSNETPDNFTLPKYIQVDGQDFATDVPKTWLPVYKPTGDSLKDQDLDAKTGKGLLFIDELSRATPLVLNVVLPLVNEGVFNGYKLGSGWTIICASNRAEDEMSGQTSIGNALGNRFSQVYYEPTVNTWKDWAKTLNYMSPLLLQWLSMPESENMSGGKFFYMDPNEDMDSIAPTTLMCTPRSWTNAMRELAPYAETGTLEGFSILDIPREIIAMALNTNIPAQAIDAFLAFLDVIGRIGDFDRAVREVWTNNGANLKIAKKDMNLITLPLAQLICSSHANTLPTEDEFNSMANWLVSANSDQLASYVIDVFKNVFMSDISEKDRDLAFIIVAKSKDAKSIANWSVYENACKPFFNRWGVSIEDGTCPDYSTGLRIIAKKYIKAFKSAIVDGVEALG